VNSPVSAHSASCAKRCSLDDKGVFWVDSRQFPATRWALSKSLTSLSAPLSCTASGEDRRRMRTLGPGVFSSRTGIVGGAWVAIKRTDRDRWGDVRRERRSFFWGSGEKKLAGYNPVWSGDCAPPRMRMT